MVGSIDFESAVTRAVATRFCMMINQETGDILKENYKTNAMRILDRQKIDYQAHHYSGDDGCIDGLSVARKIGEPIHKVFKTLVTQAPSKQYYVFVIPVSDELDLKAAARAVHEKSVEMIKVADINKVTGYIRGGCSPIGMKKQYITVIDRSALALDSFFISAGKIGYQIQISADNLKKVLDFQWADLVSHSD